MAEQAEYESNVTFQTEKSEEIKFGNNNFLEVARKKAVTGEGENEFVSISRGFFTPEGEKRFRKSIAMPVEKEVVDGVVDALKKMLK
ncbi:MAG: hypothetical protein KAI53_05990 [Candidatus Aenigmarchaeota archaeon]|nr:hypothetical protein [Candidatus Aenigmarchaeota archaeon]